MNHPSQTHFTQAEAHWDVERLYQDLTKVKGHTHTKMEKIHLRGLLCGYSPRDIAEKLHRSVRGVEAFMCNTLYQYIKQLSNHDGERMRNHREILQWLEEMGYRLPISLNSSSPPAPWTSLIHTLNGAVHVLNSSVHIEHFDPVKNRMVVLNILRVEMPCPSTDQKGEEAFGDEEVKKFDSDSDHD